MCQDKPDFEVRIKGQTLVSVSDGRVKVDGKDFHSDVKNLAALIDILSGVLETADSVKKPRLISEGGKKYGPQIVPPQAVPFLKVIQNQA